MCLCLFVVLVDAYGQCRRRVTVLHFWREIQADTCWWRRRPGPALTVLAVTKPAVSSNNLLIINFPASLSYYRETCGLGPGTFPTTPATQTILDRIIDLVLSAPLVSAEC